GKRVEPGIHGSFHRVPYDTDDDPFDRQRFLAQIDLDRLEIRVLRQEPDAMTFLPIPLDRDLVLEANDDDLPVANLGRAMHGDGIAVEDAGIAHAHAFDPQQEMRLLLEQIRIDLIARLDVLLGEDRRARRDPADERQAELLAQRILEPDPTRRAGQQLDRPFALERAQMLLRRIDRLELQALRDLRARRRHAGRVDRLLYQMKDLPLTRSEIPHDLDLYERLG